jgi:hypothetical protein
VRLTQPSSLKDDEFRQLARFAFIFVKIGTAVIRRFFSAFAEEFAFEMANFRSSNAGELG